MSTAHTPRPWVAVTSNINGPQGTPIAHALGVYEQPAAEANAAHIVICVNSHEDLVEALRNLIGAASMVCDYGDHGLILALSDARAALAKAGV